MVEEEYRIGVQYSEVLHSLQFPKKCPKFGF